MVNDLVSLAGNVAWPLALVFACVTAGIGHRLTLPLSTNIHGLVRRLIPPVASGNVTLLTISRSLGAAAVRLRPALVCNQDDF